MGIKIKSPGLLTTIQDLGRYGFRKYGIIVSGAMDSFAHRIANVLVGNEEGEGTLEITLIGPEILINEDTLISICGADLSPKINETSVPMWRPIYVKKGSILNFGKNNIGTRTYVAFAGSFNVDEIMGSKSTYLRAQIGGYEGRQLKRGDILQLKKPSKRALEIMDNIIGNMNKSDFVYPKWFISKKFFPYYERHSTVRIIRGGEFNYFANRSKKSLFESKFIVTPQSDRMGYRLNGPSLKIKEKIEMISEAVALGTIQVPPDGNPIILLVDRQTTGGYPKIGEVISVDIPIVAQLKPGDSISFCEVSLEEAQKLYIEREQNIEDIKMTLKIKTR